MEVDNTEKQFDQYHNASSYLGEIYDKLDLNGMKALKGASIFAHDKSVGLYYLKVKEKEIFGKYIEKFNNECSPTLHMSILDDFQTNCDPYSSSCLAKCKELKQLGEDMLTLNNELKN